MATQTKPSTPKTTGTTSARSYKNIIVSFGSFVQFPGKLYAAARDEGSGFRLAVVKDGKASPVSQFYTADSKEYFPIGQLGRAVEIGDKLIPLTSDELASLKVQGEKGQKTVEITRFVPLAQVDPTFFDNSYVIAADADPKKGDPNSVNLYGLLLTVLVQTGKVGMAKMYDRDKEYNVIIRPTFDGKKLMLHTIFSSREVRDIDIPTPTLAFTPAQVEMGKQLIEALSGDFDPKTVFSAGDTLTEELIARKNLEAAGVKIPTNTPTASSTVSQADALMAMMAASLNAMGKTTAPAPKTEETTIASV